MKLALLSVILSSLLIIVPALPVAKDAVNMERAIETLQELLNEDNELRRTEKRKGRTDGGRGRGRAKGYTEGSSGGYTSPGINKTEFGTNLGTSTIYQGATYTYGHYNKDEETVCESIIQGCNNTTAGECLENIQVGVSTILVCIGQNYSDILACVDEAATPSTDTPQTQRTKPVLMVSGGSEQFQVVISCLCKTCSTSTETRDSISEKRSRSQPSAEEISDLILSLLDKALKEK